MSKHFTPLLLAWHRSIDRALPWKINPTPYKIWLAEIIMQQTRIAQGMPYYEKFISQYPTIHDLANADTDEVMRLWQGLGYYSRARNLIKTARIVSHKYAGTFPKEYKKIIALPGIGEYTAAAILSFAFAQDYAVVDGNVFRVLSRFYADETPIDISGAKKHYQTMAEALLPKGKSGAFNQAIMDFGALLCKPKDPQCQLCPLRANCQARQKDKVHNLPVKSRKLKKKKRNLHFLLITDGRHIALEKRYARDIWKDLYQPPLWEHDKQQSYAEMKLHFKTKYDLKNLEWHKNYRTRQELTHQTLMLKFVAAKVESHAAYRSISWLPIAQAQEVGMPIILRKSLNEFIASDIIKS